MSPQLILFLFGTAFVFVMIIIALIFYIYNKNYDKIPKKITNHFGVGDLVRVKGRQNNIRKMVHDYKDIRSKIGGIHTITHLSEKSIVLDYVIILDAQDFRNGVDLDLYKI